MKINKQEAIILHTTEHKTFSELAIKYGVSYQAISNMFRVANVKHKTTYGKLYHCDETFFDNLTPQVSYVLGLLYDD